MERPILFSGEMVKAILDGRKTQTRRVCKGQPQSAWTGVAYEGDEIFMTQLPHPARMPMYCPYGKAGDRLWVREGFKQVASGEVKDSYGEVRYGIAYKAGPAVAWQSGTTIIHDLSGDPDTGPMQFKDRPWKPSIHMPRRFSRINLEITNVRVERLQSISREDAVSEGMCSDDLIGKYVGVQNTHFPEENFRYLWDGINGKKHPWHSNPWVWVIEFKTL